MSSILQKCAACGNDVIFSEDPYGTPGATRYWKATYDEPEQSMLIIQRKTPFTNKKGKMTIRVTNEHVLAVFCNAQCGLEYEQRSPRD